MAPRLLGGRFATADLIQGGTRPAMRVGAVGEHGGLGVIRSAAVFETLHGECNDARPYRNRRPPPCPSPRSQVGTQPQPDAL